MFEIGPWDEWKKANEEMEDWMAQLFRRPMVIPRKDDFFRMPVCEMHQTPSELDVTIELPGIEKQDIHLNVAEEFLEIKADASHDKNIRKKNMSGYELSTRKFFRRIPLPAKINPDKVDAEFKNGVLSLHMPKLQVLVDKTRRIPIK
jgi:HSP20 family protein